MKPAHIAPALMLFGLLSAHAEDGSAAGQKGQTPPSTQMNIRQELMSSLSKSGYTDLSVVPMSFLVHGKDKNGRPVAMMIGPDSVTEVTEVALPQTGAGMEKPLTSEQLDAFLKSHGEGGTLTLEQATKAAKSHFETLDKRHDGKVDQNELIPAGVSTQDFDANNPDKDTTLEQGEYANLVKKKFEAADANGDGKLTKSELSSKAGEAVVRLLQ